MQFWPRVRARHKYARIRRWQTTKEAKPLGFAGYKVGMTHTLILDNNPNSLTKGAEIFCPTTVIECPPLKVNSIIFYKNTKNGIKLTYEKISDSNDKDPNRKTQNKNIEQVDFDFLRLKCSTQPKLTSIGKKKPEMFEIAVGGDKEQQLSYAAKKLGMKIKAEDVFKEGQLLDAHSLTKGKGFQGPVRRFGVQLRSHKSEKSRRNPGSLGPWKAQGHVMWRTAHAGKTGYNLRTEYNKQLIKIGNKADEINAKGGFIDYGNVKNQYLLLKGSIAGARKRLIRFTDAARTHKKVLEAPQLLYTSTESKQGR